MFQLLLKVFPYMLRKCYIIPLARQIEIQPLFLVSLVIMITLKFFTVIKFIICATVCKQFFHVRGKKCRKSRKKRRMRRSAHSHHHYSGAVGRALRGYFRYSGANGSYSGRGSHGGTRRDAGGKAATRSFRYAFSLSKKYFRLWLFMLCTRPTSRYMDSMDEPP